MSSINVIGVAVKELLSKGIIFEREHRTDKKLHGVEMKQDLQGFVLIAKTGTFEESGDVGFVSVHRFLVLNSLHQDCPIVIALKPWNQRDIKFYVFDPWKVKEEKGDLILREGHIVYVNLPIRLGWRWTPSKDLAKVWEKMKAARHKTLKLNQFAPS